MNALIVFIYTEPRYYLMKTHVFDRWKNKEIDYKDIIEGHDCAFFVPARFVEAFKHEEDK
jgi:hypothetical protein